MNKLDVADFCARAVSEGLGEYALNELAYYMARNRDVLESRVGEYRNCLKAIHKINAKVPEGYKEAIANLSDLEVGE